MHIVIMLLLAAATHHNIVDLSDTTRMVPEQFIDPLLEHFWAHGDPEGETVEGESTERCDEAGQ